MTPEQRGDRYQVSINATQHGNTPSYKIHDTHNVADVAVQDGATWWTHSEHKAQATAALLNRLDTHNPDLAMALAHTLSTISQAIEELEVARDHHVPQTDSDGYRDDVDYYLNQALTTLSSVHRTFTGRPAGSEQGVPA